MQQIFFGRGFKRALHIEQARLDHDDGGGNAALVAQDELHVGPLLDLGAAAARAAEEGQLHGAGIHIESSALVRSPTNWLAPAKPISA